jgi:hypothetical protein
MPIAKTMPMIAITAMISIKVNPLVAEGPEVCLCGFMTSTRE